MSTPVGPTAAGASVCAACGALLEPGAAFCGSCGARVLAAGAGAAPAAWSLGADVDDAVAPVWRRLVALLVDQALAVLVGGAGLLAVLPTLRAERTDGSLGALLVPGLLLLLLAAGQWFAEAFGGRTVGGALLGTRTVSARTGRAPGLWAVLVRSVVQAAGVLLGGIGVYVVAGSGAWDEGPEQRGWHDKAAGTLVLRARAPRRDDPDPAPPAAAAPAPDAGRTAPTSWPPRSAAATAPAATAPDAPITPPDAPARPTVTAPAPAATPTVATAPRHAASSAPSTATAPTPTTDTPLDLPDSTVPTASLGDLEHTRVGRWAGSLDAASSTLALVLDTGERVAVTGPGLVGRRPVPGTEQWAHLVTIDDPGQSVSSTHLAFWPVDGGLDVLDRGSTNGTVLLDAAGKPWSLPPGQPARVGAGWTLVLGSRRITVVQA